MTDLERAAEISAVKYYSDGEYPIKIKDIIEDYKAAFKAGANWQKQRSPWVSAKDSLPYMHEELIHNHEYPGFNHDWTVNVLVHNSLWGIVYQDVMHYIRDKGHWTWHGSNDQNIDAWRLMPEYKEGGKDD